MGEEEFDDTVIDEPEMDASVSSDNDSEVLRSESAPQCDARSHYKRQLLEKRLEQRRLEQELQDYDFEFA